MTYAFFKQKSVRKQKKIISEKSKRARSTLHEEKTQAQIQMNPLTAQKEVVIPTYEAFNRVNILFL